MAIRNIISVQIIIAYGAELGVAEDKLLQGSGLVHSDLIDHERFVEDRQELHILKNLMNHTSNPFKVGMELGSRYHITSYGIMGYALLASSSFRKAIALGLRYLDLTYAFSEIKLTDHHDDLSLEFSCDIPGDLGLLVLTRDIWGANTIQQEVSESINSSLKLQLSMPLPCDISLKSIEKKRGGKVYFNANFNGFSGKATQLDLPLKKANEATARVCEEQCSQLLQQKHNWKPIAKQVKDALVHLGMAAAMKDIAQYLTRTTRTLHRQLKKEQTSWRQVRDDVRIGIAEELLLQPIHLEEVAERLGFSDGANFSHSFKRCKNITPSQYRKQILVTLEPK